MLDKQPFTCVLVSDFNLQNFGGYVANTPEPPDLKAVATPFGQPVSTLLDDDLPCWQNTPDAAVVWTRPQAVISDFNALVRYEQVSLQNILRQVDEYCTLLINVSRRVKYVFIPSWVLPSARSAFGLMDMKAEIGLTNTLMRMNLRLAENLEKASNIYVLNALKWVAQAGMNAFNPKLWYLGKIALVMMFSKQPLWTSRLLCLDCWVMPASSSFSTWMIPYGAALWATKFKNGSILVIHPNSASSR